MRREQIWNNRTTRIVSMSVDCLLFHSTQKKDEEEEVGFCCSRVIKEKCAAAVERRFLVHLLVFRILTLHIFASTVVPSKWQRETSTFALFLTHRRSKVSISSAHLPHYLPHDYFCTVQQSWVSADSKYERQWWPTSDYIRPDQDYPRRNR